MMTFACCTTCKCIGNKLTNTCCMIRSPLIPPYTHYPFNMHLIGVPDRPPPPPLVGVGVGVSCVGSERLCLWRPWWCRPYRYRGPGSSAATAASNVNSKVRRMVLDNIVVVWIGCRFIREHHSGFVVISKNQDG
jgi:hypothetical protein